MAARLLNLNDVQCADAFFFPAGMQPSHLGEVGLSARAQVQPNGDALLSVSTVRFAHCVTIDVPGYLAEDQYFHLAPHHERAIRLRPLREGVRPKGTVKALNAKAVKKIETVE
jgi:beta-mannosidase